MPMAHFAQFFPLSYIYKYSFEFLMSLHPDLVRMCLS